MSYNDPISLDELLDHAIEIENASIEEDNDNIGFKKERIENLEERNEVMEKSIDDLSDAGMIKIIHYHIKEIESFIIALRRDIESIERNTKYREMCIETLEKIKGGS
jgi:prefoldin subunit 5